MDAVYTVAELAKRWKCHENTVREWEQAGRLHRLPNIPGVRYSAIEIAQLENVGLDAEVPTAWDYRRVITENADLRKENGELKKRMAQIMGIVLGGTS